MIERRLKDGRGGAIRTHDLLNPIQTRYQATLRPDRIHWNPGTPGDQMRTSYGLGISFQSFSHRALLSAWKMVYRTRITTAVASSSCGAFWEK
jgi:hypothetical protein